MSTSHSRPSLSTNASILSTSRTPCFLGKLLMSGTIPNVLARRWRGSLTRSSQSTRHDDNPIVQAFVENSIHGIKFRRNPAPLRYPLPNDRHRFGCI
nr:uncharacterized protein CTRU02_04547 [Colletotrichum truncatum]KAF6795737.1 hypothetical protein CTRU02_04547 [Colletotrichum truncatum]